MTRLHIPSIQSERVTKLLETHNVDPVTRARALNRLATVASGKTCRLFVLKQHRCFVLALVITACLGSAGLASATGRGSGDTIRVGAVSSLTGLASFPESSAAVRAYFDMINASGGIRGRKLELIVEDDRGEAQQARMAAQKVIDDPRVVALVGNASIVDCLMNGGSYQEAGLIALHGTAVEFACFASSHIIPVNVGAYRSFRNGMQFARDVLRARRTCAFLFETPGMRPGYQAMVDSWQKQTGTPIHHLAYFGPTSDVNGLVRQAEAKQCDAVVYTGVEPQVLAWARAAQQVQALAKVPTIFNAPAYTERVANELGETGAPIYCMSEFEPWSSRSPTLTDWRSVMKRGNVPLSSFSQGGYTAAQLFVRTLRGIEGEITRARVADAMRAVRDMELPMIGMRFTVGNRPAHNPNRATLPMKLEEGKWRIADPFWVVGPE